MRPQPFVLFLLRIAAVAGAAGVACYLLKDVHPFGDPALLSLVIVLAGIAYAVLSGVAVYVSWLQFSTVQVTAVKESHLIGEFHDLSRLLSNRVEAQGLAAGLRRYVEMTLRDDWKSLATGKGDLATQRLFLDLSDRIRGLPAEDPRDARTVEGLQARLAPWGHLREKRITWGMTRIPVPLWHALMFIACVIQLLMLFFPTTNFPTHLAAVIFTAALLAWTQWMIRDLDNPFSGYWCLSPASFQEVGNRLGIEAEKRAETLENARTQTHPPRE